MTQPLDTLSPSLSVSKRGVRMADVVFAQLRRAIIRHEIPPDSHLSVPQLAARLGTSRSPVHEAVKRLVQEGLAVEYPRRGAFVVSFNIGGLFPLYEMRAVLDGLTARLVAQRATAQELIQLRSALDRQAAALQNDDVEQHVESDMDFHRLLIEMSGNPHLQETLRNIYTKIHGAMSARAIRTSPTLALQDHQAILTAIEKRDAYTAEDEAKRHVCKILDHMAGALQLNLSSRGQI